MPPEINNLQKKKDSGTNRIVKIAANMNERLGGAPVASAMNGIANLAIQEIKKHPAAKRPGIPYRRGKRNAARYAGERKKALHEARELLNTITAGTVLALNTVYTDAANRIIVTAIKYQIPLEALEQILLRTAQEAQQFIVGDELAQNLFTQAEAIVAQQNRDGLERPAVARLFMTLVTLILAAFMVQACTEPPEPDTTTDSATPTSEATTQLAQAESKEGSSNELDPSSDTLPPPVEVVASNVISETATVGRTPKATPLAQAWAEDNHKSFGTGGGLSDTEMQQWNTVLSYLANATNLEDKPYYNPDVNQQLLPSRAGAPFMQDLAPVATEGGFFTEEQAEAGVSMMLIELGDGTIPEGDKVFYVVFVDAAGDVIPGADDLVVQTSVKSALEDSKVFGGVEIDSIDPESLSIQSNEWGIGLYQNIDGESTLIMLAVPHVEGGEPTLRYYPVGSVDPEGSITLPATTQAGTQFFMVNAPSSPEAQELEPTREAPRSQRLVRQIETNAALTPEILSSATLWGEALPLSTDPAVENPLILVVPLGDTNSVASWPDDGYFILESEGSLWLVDLTHLAPDLAELGLTYSDFKFRAGAWQTALDDGTLVLIEWNQEENEYAIQTTEYDKIETIAELRLKDSYTDARGTEFLPASEETRTPKEVATFPLLVQPVISSTTEIPLNLTLIELGYLTTSENSLVSVLPTHDKDSIVVITNTFGALTSEYNGVNGLTFPEPDEVTENMAIFPLLEEGEDGSIARIHNHLGYKTTIVSLSDAQAHFPSARKLVIGSNGTLFAVDVMGEVLGYLSYNPIRNSELSLLPELTWVDAGKIESLLDPDGEFAGEIEIIIDPHPIIVSSSVERIPGTSAPLLRDFASMAQTLDINGTACTEDVGGGKVRMLGFVEKTLEVSYINNEIRTNPIITTCAIDENNGVIRIELPTSINGMNIGTWNINNHFGTVTGNLQESDKSLNGKWVVVEFKPNVLQRKFLTPFDGTPVEYGTLPEMLIGSSIFYIVSE